MNWIGVSQKGENDSNAPQGFGAAELSAVGAMLVGAVALGILIGRRQFASELKRKARRRITPVPVFDDPAAAGIDAISSFNSRFCPVCRSEFVSGTATCEDCGVELVDEAELPEFDRPIDESIIGIFRIRSSYKGQLIRQYLAANGIPCMLSRSSLWDMLEADRVCVFESDAVRAKKLIREFIEQTEWTATEFGFEPR